MGVTGEKGVRDALERSIGSAAQPSMRLTLRRTSMLAVFPYTALSRHTHGVAMIANAEAERAAVTQQRPLGERAPVTERICWRTWPATWDARTKQSWQAKWSSSGAQSAGILCRGSACRAPSPVR